MNRVFTKKPPSDQKLKFAPMGKKPGITKVDVENAADAKKPGDKKEDAKDLKKKKLSPFAKKAAAALAGKG
jgi:hypothetical protein